MNQLFGTPAAKIVVINAHLPEQMDVVARCARYNYPVTFYTDKVTDRAKFFSGSPHIQMRVGQIDPVLLKTLYSDESVIVVDDKMISMLFSKENPSWLPFVTK